MKIRTILTPYFLDQEESGLEGLVQPDWYLNKVELHEAEQQLRMAALYQGIADFTTQAVSAGARTISIAGDCCASLGVMAGLQRAALDPVLVWFDAHGDFNTWETTPSGFLGGMPLAMMVGRGQQTILESLGMEIVDEQRVLLTDGRDLDPGEKLAVESSGLRHLENPLRLVEEPLLEGPLYVHFDVDIINPAQAPAVDYPAKGGPSVEEIEQVFRFLAGTGEIAAVSMSTWNSEKDEGKATEQVCLQLLDTLVGK